jgi:chemotaxis protein methyltransferase CheR
MTIVTLTCKPSALDGSTFEYVRKLVHDYSAIALEASKDYLVESRLLPVAHQQGLTTIRELVTELRARPFGNLHTQVVEAMTTNETSFFRDVHPFEALKKDVLPQLISARAATKTLSIWSAGCSTGQEPYTIAILLAEHFPRLADWNLQICGTDLSQQVLERATAGEFTQLEVNRGLPAALLIKYFEKHGMNWRINPDIRRRVQFTRANLIEHAPPQSGLDIVFLRNVLIYFTADTKRRILATLQKHLARDGVLFLGGAETTLGIDDAWERVCHGQTSTYRLNAATSSLS